MFVAASHPPPTRRVLLAVVMLPPHSLVNNPHPNIIGTVAIDDRVAAVDMPILLPRANGDFEQVLKHGGWTMPAKLRCGSLCVCIPMQIASLCWGVCMIEGTDVKCPPLT